MKTRNRYYYEVAHDNTERFKNSAIIAMQRLQNEDRKQLCKWVNNICEFWPNSLFIQGTQEKDQQWIGLSS